MKAETKERERPLMDLNNNPRVSAEKRLKQLTGRRDGLIRYKSTRLSIEREGGAAVRMYINPYIKAGKAGKLIALINKEILKIEKYLRQWK